MEKFPKNFKKYHKESVHQTEGKYHLYSEYIEILEKDVKPVNTITEDTDHRLSLRIPKYLMDKVDEKRKTRVGKISRNLWILELIERATR